MPSWRARLMPVATSPLRRPSRTSSRCRWRVAVPQPSGRSPAEMVTRRAAPLRMADRERDADHAAEAGADEGHRRGAAAAVEPGGHQVGEAEHRDGRRRRRVVEAAPRRAVARPARAQHRHARRVDEVGGEQRRPPRLAAALRFAAAVAERKRRRGDAADDDDHRRGAELGAVGPPAERPRRRAWPSIVIDGRRTSRRRGRRQPTAVSEAGAVRRNVPSLPMKATYLHWWIHDREGGLARAARGRRRSVDAAELAGTRSSPMPTRDARARPAPPRPKHSPGPRASRRRPGDAAAPPSAAASSPCAMRTACPVSRRSGSPMGDPGGAEQGLARPPEPAG